MSFPTEAGWGTLGRSSNSPDVFVRDEVEPAECNSLEMTRSGVRSARQRNGMNIDVARFQNIVPMNKIEK